MLAASAAATNGDDARARTMRYAHWLAVTLDERAVREASRRDEQLERCAPGRPVAQAERVRRIVEGMLEDRAGDGARVDARQPLRAAEPLAAVGALAVVESPATRADLLPQPEGRVRAQPILQIELGRDPGVGDRRSRIDAVLA